MGNGVDGVAFFWFPDAPEGVRGESLQDRRGVTAIGTHEPRRVRRARRAVRRVPAEAASTRASRSPQIINHANSLDGGHKPDYDPATDDGDVFIRSIYFQIPTARPSSSRAGRRALDESDVRHAPATTRSLAHSVD